MNGNILNWRLLTVTLIPMLPLLLGVFMLCDNINEIDGRYYPDDTYYIASIARNIGSGLGFSADGMTQTSGFQPLFVFLATPIFLLFQGPAAFYALSVLSLAFIPAVVIIFALLLTRKGGGNIAVGTLTGIIFVGGYGVLRVALNGMESTLSTFMALISILLFDGAVSKAKLRGFFVLGFALGGLLLSRIDGVFVCVAIAIACLALRLYRGLFYSAVSALLVVAPWWLFCARKFGSIIPESGAAVKLITQFHQSGYLTSGRALFFILEDVSAFIFPFRSSLVGALIVGFSTLLAMRYIVLKRDFTVVVMLCASWLYIIFYLLYLPAFWFFDRYLLTAYVLLILCGMISANEIIFSRGFLTSRRAAGIWAFLAFIVCAGSILGKWTPVHVLYARGMNARGYRAPAIWVVDKLPRNAQVGSFQSGALSYFGQGKIEVFNLDGVVDGAAYAAARDRMMNYYICSKGIDYFYDWDFNVRYLGYVSSAGLPLELNNIARLPSASADNFSLYEVKGCK
ncbi:hypothetical protein [Xanthomonas massiliensis]|uniref:hypothetical protein n=1 Tax=Xanthomonas massiliensis TaxID=1720302 RepID=UPI000A937065|nr:hypothetical protein [Xanthomonas massiliensis]